MGAEMKAWVLKNLDYVSWDRLGMGLSFLCAIHCLLTPIVILSLPILARYYLVHPLVHYGLALVLLPVGLLAFYAGLRHHRNYWVLILGIPGLFVVAVVPYLVHELSLNLNEPVLMVVGSLLLISAHWINRRSCAHCAVHKLH
jgi:hypothetical protein